MGPISLQSNAFVTNYIARFLPLNSGTADCGVIVRSGFSVEHAGAAPRTCRPALLSLPAHTVLLSYCFWLFEGESQSRPAADFPTSYAHLLCPVHR